MHKENIEPDLFFEAFCRKYRERLWLLLHHTHTATASPARKKNERTWEYIWKWKLHLVSFQVQVEQSSVYEASQLTWLGLCLVVVRKLSTAQEKVKRAGSRKRVYDAVSVYWQRVVASIHAQTSHKSLTVSFQWFLWGFLCPRRWSAPYVGRCRRFCPQPNSASENLSSAAYLLDRPQPSLEWNTSMAGWINVWIGRENVCVLWLCHRTCWTSIRLDCNYRGNCRKLHLSILELKEEETKL